MELEPRYIRAVNEKYEVDESFIDKLKTFNLSHSLKIIEQIKAKVDDLPKKSIDTQYLSGVVECVTPLFFEFEFLNEPGYVPIFIDIHEISSDYYLDSIIDNHTI